MMGWGGGGKVHGDRQISDNKEDRALFGQFWGGRSKQLAGNLGTLTLRGFQHCSKGFQAAKRLPTQGFSCLCEPPVPKPTINIHTDTLSMPGRGGG